MAEAKDVKAYVLKAGAEHSAIVNGEVVTKVGDGEVTFDLTEGQYDAFKDKFFDPDAEAAKIAADKAAAAAQAEHNANETKKDAAANAKAAETPKGK